MKSSNSNNTLRRYGRALAMTLAAVASLAGTSYSTMVWAQDAAAAPSKEKYVHAAVAAPQTDDTNPKPRVSLSSSEWRKRLSPLSYNVTRRAGTEQPFTHPYADWHEQGIFRCVNCGLELFTSRAKFESGTGWPSFYEPIAKNRVAEKIDRSLGSIRTEVRCARCDAHLGHVFDDGPLPTGLRYCMNGAALTFRSNEASKKDSSAAPAPPAATTTTN